MKLLTYSTPDSPDLYRIGIYLDRADAILPLEETGLSFSSMNELVRTISPAALKQLSDEASAISQAPSADTEALKERLIPYKTSIRRSPIPFPDQDIICLGINYAAHAEESARFKKEAFERDRKYPVYFSKRVNEAVPDGGSVPSHGDLTQQLDYEAELAVVLCRDARNVPAEKAFEYIFGYTILNDISAREVQTLHKQWYFGKSLDGFTPMGPWIVTKDEFEEPPVLPIRSYVNGELRQNSDTGMLMFSIAQIIEELSSGMTIRAGSIISTGTPAGVGMGFTPPNFLKKGDVVTCEIEGIGRLTNTIA